MQSCFPCQCGKQIQIPHRSSGGQTSDFIGCATCGTLYPFPQESVSQESVSQESVSQESVSQESVSQESVSQESVSQESVSQESVSQESVSQESLRREFATWDENESKSEFVARESEPSGNVLSGATTQSPYPEKSLLRKVILFFEGYFASRVVYPLVLVDDYSCKLSDPEDSYLQKVIPPVLGGLAALSIAIVTIWYVFGRGVGGTGDVSRDVPRIVPQTQLEDRFEISDASISKNQPVKFSSQRKKLPVESPESIQSPEMIASGTAESIKTLRRLQNDLSNVPADKKDAMMAAYYSTAKKLSKQLASLRGRSVLRWRKALEDLASEILKDNNTRMVMQNGPIGKLPGINASSENDFVVTVLTIGAWDKPDPSSLWSLNEPWNLGEQQISVQMLPGAWNPNTEMEPTNCLVFGRLIAIDSSNAESSTIKQGTLTLQVHAAMPE